METLSSSFLARNPQLLNVSSFTTMNQKRPNPIIISSNSSFTTLKNPKTQTQKSLKNPPPSNSNSKPSLLATIFNKLDDCISNFVDSPLAPTVDPQHVLTGNFLPVDELSPTSCDVVEGSLPPCLDGAYIRNGPNPQFIPNGPYHLFEGDGMLHMIKISKGKPTFCSRYVRTHKHTVEREAGYPFVPSIFSSFSGGVAATLARAMLTCARIATGQFDPIARGFGASNTSIFLFARHLYTLCEADLPYAIRVTADGDIKTLGRHDFQSPEPLFRMTAHPKVDPATGEAFAYRYNSTRPFLTLFRITPKGKKQKDVHIHSMEGLTAIHDFAITSNYIIIPDIQIVVNPIRVLGGGSPVETDASKVARVGVIPRYAVEEEGEMVWIKAAGLNPLHCFNAWEEDDGDKIVMVASNALVVDQVLKNIDSAELTMEKIVINVKERTVKRLALSPLFLEFGVINPAYAAKKNRYIYAGIVGTKRSLGLVKLDLALPLKDGGGDCTVASRLYEPGCQGGEPFFVAREPNNPAAEEDDGYLVTFIYDENTHQSKFLVMDAKSPTLETIAAVKLPQRIPNGFHGLFVSESDLNKLID